MSTDFAAVSIKMAGSLVLILGIIIVLFYLFKRLRLGPLSHNKFPEMRILGTLSLAPKRAIALIEVCDQWLIVGIGTENVTLISKLVRPTEVFNSGDEIPSKERRFRSILQNISLGKGGPRGTGMKEDAKI